jgi:hypothetical protein
LFGDTEAVVGLGPGNAQQKSLIEQAFDHKLIKHPALFFRKELKARGNLGIHLTLGALTGNNCKNWRRYDIVSENQWVLKAKEIRMPAIGLNVTDVLVSGISKL